MKDLKKISFLHLNLKLFLYIIIGADYCLNVFHMKGIRFEYIYIYIYIYTHTRFAAHRNRIGDYQQKQKMKRVRIGREVMVGGCRPDQVLL